MKDFPVAEIPARHRLYDKYKPTLIKEELKQQQTSTRLYSEQIRKVEERTPRSFSHFLSYKFKDRLYPTSVAYDADKITKSVSYYLPFFFNSRLSFLALTPRLKMIPSHQLRNIRKISAEHLDYFFPPYPPDCFKNNFYILYSFERKNRGETLKI